MAHQFSRSGFDAKAVAIYKQILKVDAQCLDARVKLGEHFQRMGLGSEALRELQEAVNICQERGLKRQAFDLLKRVAELDPDNIPNRLSLADLLVREKLLDEARLEFSKLLEKVEAEGAADQIVRVSEQMLATFPDAEDAVISFAQAKVKVGMAEDAIACLTDVMPRFPESVPVREALVAAYDAAGDAQMKRAVYVEIAELFKRRGNDDEARQILQCHVPVEGLSGEPDTGEAEPLSMVDLGDGGLVDFSSQGIGTDSFREPPAEVPKLTPEPEPEPEAEAPESYEELVAQAKVELDFGDPEQARALAERALRLDPNAQPAQEVLRSLAPDQEEDDDTSTLPDIELVLVDEPDDTDPFASVEPPLEVEMQGMIDPPSPGAEGRPAAVDAEPDQEDEEIEIVFDDLDLESADLGQIEAEEQAKHLVEGDEPPPAPPSATWGQQSTWVGKTLEAAEAIFAKGLLDEAKMLYEQVLQHAPNHPQAMLRLGEISENGGEDPSQSGPSLDLSFADTQIEGTPASAPEADGLDDFELDAQGLDDLLHPDPGEEDASEIHSAAPATIEPSAADDAANEFEIEFDEPEAPEAESAGLDLDVEFEDFADDSTPVTVAPGFGDTLQSPSDPVASPPTDDVVSDDEDFVIAADAGSTDEEPEDRIDELLDAFPDDAIRPAEPEPEPEDDGFDLAAELEAGQSSDVEPAFADVFRAFKKGIEEQVAAEDASAHYDLAIAYKEMGLVDDAVEALEKVQSTGPLGVEGVSLLATCKLEQGKADEAAVLLEGALAQASSAEEQIALRYDLGLAFAAAGRPREALAAFRDVAEKDPSFREVQEQISDLSSGSTDGPNGA